MDKGKAPLIGIAQNARRTRELSQIFFQLNDLKVDLFSFAPVDIQWRTKKIRGICLDDGEWIEAVFPFPDVIYNQCYSSKKKIIRRFEKYIGKNKVFNHITRLDKWDVYRILKASEVGKILPATFLCNDIDFLSLLEAEGCLVLKPRRGHFGRGVFSVDAAGNIYRSSTKPDLRWSTQEELQQQLEKLINMDSYIAQKKISAARVNQRIFDLRVLVQKNSEGKWSIAAVASRVTNKGLYITNCCREVKCTENVLETGDFDTRSIMELVYKMSVQAATGLESVIGHLGEIGIDFLLDSDGRLWLIEVNGKPVKGFLRELNNDVIWKNIFLNPIRYARFIAQEPIH